MKINKRHNVGHEVAKFTCFIRAQLIEVENETNEKQMERERVRKAKAQNTDSSRRRIAE